MDIHEEPIEPSGASNGHYRRDYLVDMIKSLSALARRSNEREIAILLDAIVAVTMTRARRKR